MSRPQWDRVVTAAETIRREQAILVAYGERFSASAEKIANGAASIESSSQRFDELLVQRLSQFETIPHQHSQGLNEGGERHLKKMAEAAGLLAVTMTDLASKQEQIFSRIETTCQSQADAIGRHNESPELALKSRGEMRQKLINRWFKMCQKYINLG